ncbi:MAG: DUF134 domain-containing protein [Candidatus Margulisiibacteriota bacterium]|nr:DUF134 domain-containing protein [Candidatus Margulisiibacteriota bacterium]
MAARPYKWRKCSTLFRDYFFKPQGMSPSKNKIANLKIDELEAMRLCDVDDLDHEDAAKKVGVSRRTIERLLNSGRFKVVGALIKGYGIQITYPKYISFKKGGKKR